VRVVRDDTRARRFAPVTQPEDVESVLMQAAATTLSGLAIELIS
jgi:hypothetical protein